MPMGNQFTIKGIFGILSMALDLLPFFSKFTDSKLSSCYAIIRHPSAGSRVIILRLITTVVFLSKMREKLRTTEVVVLFPLI